MLLVILTSEPLKYLFVNVFAFSTKNKSKQALEKSIMMTMMMIIIISSNSSSSITTFITIKDLRLMTADWIFIIHQIVR